MQLPKLLDGWHWGINSSNGTPSACLFTLEYDCIVYFENGSIHINSGVAPWECIYAVMVANKLIPMEGVADVRQEDKCSSIV
jgi:hypothetical protein